MLGHNCNFLQIVVVLLAVNYSCIRIYAESVNDTIVEGVATFFPGIATWYGNPSGAGSDGGACGFTNDVEKGPYYGFVTAGSNKIYKGGSGCGACYRVKCTNNPSCSSKPIEITVTDECPGCESNLFHFDLSGIAFGALAKPGQGNNLRNAGRINVQFQRAICHHKANVKIKIDSGSNPSYLAFVVENVDGYGDIARVELLPSKPGASWVPMVRSWGETWKADINSGLPAPYSVRFTGSGKFTSIVAKNLIPAQWKSGNVYYSNINFH